MRRCWFLLVLFFVGCGASELETKSDFAMNTICSVSLPGSAGEDRFDQVFNWLKNFESRVSRTRSDSEIIRAGLVSDDTAALISFSLDYSLRTQGLFDPTIGSLTSVWQIGSSGARVPSSEELREGLALVDSSLVSIENGILTLGPGQKLDFGAVAKGWAADRIRDQLKEAEISRGIINFGGNVAVFGKKSSGKPWTIGIQDPYESRGISIGVLSLDQEGAVVTSGVYERFFVAEDGKRYHHVLDPRSGVPGESDAVSVTVFGPNAADADVLATVCLLEGIPAGKERIEKTEGYEAIFVAGDRGLFLSSGARELFFLTNGDYNIRDTKL